MSTLTNFPIRAKGKLSQELLRHGIFTFHDAIHWLASLPQREISDSRRLELLLLEQQGSVCARHAFLAQLAAENQVQSIKLVLCAFNMGPENTAAIDEVLSQYSLHAIPEVVCLLKYQDTIYDITGEDLLPVAHIISDIEISPLQINNFKKRYHRNYIENWLQIEKIRHLDADQIWRVREECLRVIYDKTHRAQLCCA